MEKAPEVSIITRCRNRLEYTIQVVNAVRTASQIDYEHIIVDNASSDGTYEWFKWMKENTSWFDKLRYVRMEYNEGDWGGMLKGFGHTRGNYIVQLDNDIIPCEGWLRVMKTVLEMTEYKVVMLKRDNVAWKLKPLSEIRHVGLLQVARVERAVACYMMSKDNFMKCYNNIPPRLGKKSKYIMAKLLHPIGKILNRTCIELEADFQRKKYDPKNPQIWEKI